MNRTETEKKQPLIVLSGPTGVGKTDLSILLARAAGGEIVSADSMQVYRGLDIGSAKIRKEEMKGIPHHLIDVLDPEESFDVVRFSAMAEEACSLIRKRGHVPILTGGTGFYIQAVVRGIDFTDCSENPALREEWAKLAEEQGPEVLHAMLKERDPEAAEAIHPHNVRRTIRALEFYEMTSARISEHNSREQQRSSPYALAWFVLTDDRKRLYDRINARVDKMLEAGLEEEVRGLYERGLTEEHTSMKGIGYKEFFPYFRGMCSMEETAAAIKQNTRRYAKRQLTWFRREKEAVWVDRQVFRQNEEEMLDYMLGVIREKTDIRVQI
ncbi:MAG: tRNA (adenosine(37)-N6)-dimethylallyltransferase MiaA [Eubacterium sp.]|nr:tRNA (adenosine(37)-N6)-dimethylallyltransferase MiaA [Eubacterium sp.]